MSDNPPVYAVLGRPVGRSRSPALHQHWFRRYGIPGTYVALEVPPGEEAHVGRAVRTLGLAGANVTVPLKVRIVAQLDALAPTAGATGAVNTIVRDGPRLVGHNTDVVGCARALVDAGVALDGRRAAVLGSGGAARAVVQALLGLGAARVDVVARDPVAAAALAGAAGARVHAMAPPTAGGGALAEAEVVIAATSGRPTWVEALDAACLPRLAAWMDLNYWDPDPPGRAVVLERGAHFVDGRPMFVAQAAAAFEAWTGVDPLASHDRVLPADDVW